MAYQIEYGVLKGDDISQIPSPNYNARPRPVSAIVIHNISLPPHQFGKHDKHGNHYVAAFFTNTLNPKDHPYFETIKDLQVSAHLFITREGKVLQFVNFNDRAWHAGKSSYLGQSNVNDFSIGIELEGTDDTTFDDKQYQVLSQIICAIYQAYPKTRPHLMGHSDIAPVRKTDPGAYFDWQRLRKDINTQMCDTLCLHQQQN